MAKAPLGFLLIDKPKEVGSFYVVRSLRKVFNMKRIGYAGTLDPLATGLMIVGVGEATKLLNILEQVDKVYDVVIEMGATSETYDAEGPIHPFENPRTPTKQDIEAVIEKDFSGEKMQIPPRYSAVKIAGKHAYDLVRKGREVNIPAKKVNFFTVKIHSFKYPELECSVHCGSGTYIRSFAHDLGQILGCGAYVKDLRRTKIGRHSIDDAVGLKTLTAENCRKFLLSPEKFLGDWQQCDLTMDEYKVLQNGGFIKNRWKMEAGPSLGIFDEGTVGLLELCEEGRSVKFAKKFILG